MQFSTDVIDNKDDYWHDLTSLGLYIKDEINNCPLNKHCRVYVHREDKDGNDVTFKFDYFNFKKMKVNNYALWRHQDQEEAIYKFYDPIGDDNYNDNNGDIELLNWVKSVHDYLRKGLTLNE